MITLDDLASLTPQEEEEKPQPYSNYKNNKYNIISLMAYLIGVDKSRFEAEHSSPKIEIYEKLNKDKNARIIRNLCRIRTAMEKKYTAINREFHFTYKNIGTMPDLIPSDAVMELSADGVSLQKSRPDVDSYLIAINKEISSRIGTCEGYFPEWVNWGYIKSLFIMPNGTKVEGLKAAGREYKENWNRYPYQCYINWPGGDNGNILFCDEKFVTLLYEANEDVFTDLSLLRDVGDIALENISSFLDKSSRAIVVVDCENSDPIRLAAALSSLSKAGLGKITEVLLFDSRYTTSQWEVLSDAETNPQSHDETNWGILSEVAPFPIRRVTVERLNEHKSQVDMTLTAETCREVYTNGVDSVVLVSSDSDYWALIKSLADVRFLVMVEKEKCGETMKKALDSRGIHYCYLDDFYTGASYAIKTASLTGRIQRYLDSSIRLNMKDLLDDTLRSDWVSMTPKEESAFYDRYIRKMRVDIDADGNLRLLLGS